MKTIYLKFWTLLLVAPTFFPACTEEYGPMSDLVAPPGISLPEQATEFLNHLYPNDEYTDLQYLPNAITSEGMYYIAYEDGRTVCFDDAGELLEITFPDGEVPVRLQALASTIQGITRFYDSAVIGAMRTAYGVAYELEDGRRVAAYEEGKLGFEQLNLHEGPTADELLPPTIFAFANAHFPETTIRNIVCPDTDSNPKEDFSYRLWIGDGITMTFDRDEQLQSVMNETRELLPESIIQSMPEEVQVWLRETRAEMDICGVDITRDENSIVYTFDTQGGGTYSISIENKNQPITIPSIEIKAFIDEHFGEQKCSRTVLYSEIKDRFFTSIPNGFDMVFNETGKWLAIDGNNQSLLNMKVTPIKSEIIEQIETQYGVMAVRIERDAPEASSSLLILADNRALTLDADGKITGESTRTFTPLEKAYRQVRALYPDKLDFYETSNEEGYLFRFDDGTEIRFDKDGVIR